MFNASAARDSGNAPRGLDYAAIVVLLAFCATAAGSFWNVLTLRNASLLIAATHDALAATSAVLSVLRDAETGQRGYLLTNDDDYLAPYFTARSSVDQSLHTLHTLSKQEILDTARVQRIQTLADAKFAELEKTLEAHEDGGIEGARAVVITGRGKRLMDELRLHLAALDERTLQLRRDRIAFRIRAVRIALWTTGCFLVIGVLVSAILVAMTRRQANIQRALHDERERLKATLLSIGDGVIVTDARGAVVTMNAVAEALTGWPDGSSTGRPLDEVFVIVNQQTRQPVENPALRALREGKVFGLANHTVLITPAGVETPIDDSAAPIRNPAGVPIGAVLVFRDVSERYAAEQALQASEMQLRRVIDSMFAFVGIIDLDGCLREANRAPLEVAGLRREDVIGKPFWDCGWWNFDPVIQQRLRDAFARALRGEVVRYDEIIRRADGGLTMIDFMLQPVTVDGRVSFVIPSGVDIGDRKQLESRLQSALAEAEQRADEAERGRRLLDALVEYIPEGVTIADSTGRIQLVSRHGLQIVQRSFEEVQVNLEGQTSAWCIFDSRHGRPAVTEELPLTRAVRHGEEIHNEEWTLQAADGRLVPVLCNAGPIRDSQGAIAGGVVVWRDVTDIKRIEERLRDADRRKDEFLATLAHELRNPLAPIRNGLEILRIRQSDDAEPVLPMMARQVDHMVRLIDDLLDISRVTTGTIVLQRRIFALRDAVQAAVEAVRAAVENAGHRLLVEPGAQPLWIDGDPVRISQVISNLLTNAVRYTPDGGEIRLSLRAEADSAVIAVSDTGIGIPAPMLDAVFDMFTQAHRDQLPAQQGLGIGLALVRRLVELHGGSVDAASDGEGCGTTMTVRLPRVEAGSETVNSGAAAPANMAVDAPPPLSVLVVDDNIDSALSLALLLEMSGHRSRTAHDGPGALRAAESFAPDVMLLDIGLPDMNGYEVARLVRAHPALRDVFLVAVTGWGSETDKSSAHAAGIDVHLTKPIDFPRLLELLARATDGAGAPEAPDGDPCV